MKKPFLLFALLLLLLACEKTPEPESKISFGVSEAYMMPNESRAFVVVFDNSITDQTVTWSVDTANGGTISEDPTYNNVGIYQASATPGTYKVLATLVSDPTQKACVEITVSDVAIDDEQIFYNGNLST